MDQQTPSPFDDEKLKLGLILGRRRALAGVTGRCSAGHADVLRTVRDDRLFRAVCSTWDEFCSRYLKLSRRHADRIIFLLNEFGPAYFELAELVCITPEQFREIQPAIRNHGINVNGESILIVPDNATQVFAAIKELLARSEAAPLAVPDRSVSARVAALSRRAARLGAAFHRLSKRAILPDDREQLRGCALRLSKHLAAFAAEIPKS